MLISSLPGFFTARMENAAIVVDVTKGANEVQREAARASMQSSGCRGGRSRAGAGISAVVAGLSLEEHGVETSLLKQLAMGTGLDDATVLEQADAVGKRDGRKPV